MRSPGLVGGGLVAVAVLGGVWFGYRGVGLDRMRGELVQARQAVRVPAPGAVVSVGTPPPAAGGGGLSAEERLELMRLRSEVTGLKERQRGWVGLTNRTARLRQRLAAVTNAAAGRLPEGYVPRSAARHRGTGTPEAALETFVWAMSNRDVEALILVLPAGTGEGLRQQVSREGVEQVFGKESVIPGFRVVSREEKGVEEVTLRVEVAPGTVVPMRCRKDPVGGGWRLEP